MPRSATLYGVSTTAAETIRPCLEIVAGPVGFGRGLACTSRPSLTLNLVAAKFHLKNMQSKVNSTFVRTISSSLAAMDAWTNGN